MVVPSRRPPGLGRIPGHSPAEVDRTYEELVDLGAGGYKGPWDAFWGQRYAQVMDPDGNVVDLFAPRAAAAATH